MIVFTTENMQSAEETMGPNLNHLQLQHFSR